MGRCRYYYYGKRICDEEVYGAFPCCILHIEFPDESDSEYDEIKKAKDAKVEEKVKKGDFNFVGAKIFYIDYSHEEDISELNFRGATILEGARFVGVTIRGNAIFEDALITGADIAGGNIYFTGSTITGNVQFARAKVKGLAWFNGVTIKGYASFVDVTIGGDFYFFKSGEYTNTTIKGSAHFERATIRGDVLFDDAVIENEFKCHSAEITGKLSFENTTFTREESKEEAYRKAKQAWEKLGDRKRADDYFYKEMVAKREQKAQPIKLLEQLIIQYALGYGVYPLRMMFAWIVIALIMGAFLASVTGDINDLPFGISAAFVPGYGISGYGISLSHVFSGVSLWIIRIEALVSEFFVAAFIVVFSRKFMR